MSIRPAIAVIAQPAEDVACQQRAQTLAERLNAWQQVQASVSGAQAAATPAAEPRTQLAIVVTPTHLQLRVCAGDARLTEGKPLVVELTQLDTRSNAGARLNQPLARALGLRGCGPARHIVDATAGLGEDTWLMAALGAQVTAMERNPVVAMLLQDAVSRAKHEQPAIAGRITVRAADSRCALASLAPAPEVVYLDPMFPTGRKTLERKALRIVRELVGEDDDAPALLQVALGVATNRVVVKRPLRAAPLGGYKPHHTHTGKGVRYDVYAV